MTDGRVSHAPPGRALGTLRDRGARRAARSDGPRGRASPRGPDRGECLRGSSARFCKWVSDWRVMCLRSGGRRCGSVWARWRLEPFEHLEPGALHAATPTLGLAAGGGGVARQRRCGARATRARVRCSRAFAARAGPGCAPCCGGFLVRACSRSRCSRGLAARAGGHRRADRIGGSACAVHPPAPANQCKTCSIAGRPRIEVTTSAAKIPSDVRMIGWVKLSAARNTPS